VRVGSVLSDNGTCFNVKYFLSEKIDPDEIKLWDKWKRIYKAKTCAVKRFRTTSLTGRPFDVIDHLNAALSYPGQGSGACKTTKAIADLPQELAERLADTMGSTDTDSTGELHTTKTEESLIALSISNSQI
jgi:hypothetical protein